MNDHAAEDSGLNPAAALQVLMDHVESMAAHGASS
jgi:hypothetical protein